MSEGNSNLVLRALGRRIRELRTERGYSQEAFADECGVHRTFMGTVERGESNLSFHNILKVAGTLDIALSTLFLDIESRAGNQVTKPPGKKPGSKNARKPRTAEK